MCMCAPLPPTLCDPMDCVACQAPLSMGFFSGKNTGVGCHFFLQGDLPGPGLKPTSPALAGRFFTTEPSGKPQGVNTCLKNFEGQVTSFIPHSSAFNCVFHRALGFWGDAKFMGRGGRHMYLGSGFLPFNQETAAFIAVLHFQVVWNLA